MAKEKMKVAFLGPISSYSHQVALASFPTDDYEHIAADIFDAVEAGYVSRGVVPFENSTNGSVVFTLDLFADRSHSYGHISVCGEAYLNVHHCLLGYKAAPGALYDSPELSRASTPTPRVPRPSKPRTQPLTSLDKIRRIYSHPQAFGQCEIFLAAYLKGIERIDVSSTSKAAEIVKADTSGRSAAIAGQIASDIHNLDILAKGIADKEDNTTRFFILKKDATALERSQLVGRDPVACKSLIAFTVNHRSPGALADVLDCFRRHKLNLTSINSRPSRLVPFQYIFFVEFEGSKFDDPHGAVQDSVMGVRIPRSNASAARILPLQKTNPASVRRLSDLSHLHQELTSRPPHIIHDYLSPTNSHLLNISLSDFLPASCRPTANRPFGLKSHGPPPALPQGHHLVYFPTQVPDSVLLADGTDPIQWPGEPFVRRLWAGGSLRFQKHARECLVLDGAAASCTEVIRNVTLKGQEEDEKIFVHIDRLIGCSVREGRERGHLSISEEEMSAAVVERRDIVFLKQKSPEVALEDAGKVSRIVKAPHKPDFSFSFKPTLSLLFRFSALSFNAHRIHLDPRYAREVEGHRNVLLHGPLSLVLMMSILRSVLERHEMVLMLDYKNLAPLYADEDLTVCVRRNGVQGKQSEDSSGKYEVWIAGQDGRLAVRGYAVVGESE
ncbi:MAG: prephenate dehydratase [Claussenomyces sp. TS43310]|nr:MAG: prephenate dehydratase [Claussenomyces sp. TS43310]